MSGDAPWASQSHDEYGTAGDYPGGYSYRATRYADEILEHAFPQHHDDLATVLDSFTIDLAELQVGGGNRTPFVARFDDALNQRGWGKRNFDIKTTIDDEVISHLRSHEIDMFKVGGGEKEYPGIAIEMEWNNKDPFFDRDLTNYQALHRAGALAVGVVVTRGPQLQELLKPTVLNRKGQVKYGESSTHWTKLMDRVDLGGGGECPLLLIGIEPQRITGIDVVAEVYRDLRRADDILRNWRGYFDGGDHAAARRAVAQMKAEALARMPDPTGGESTSAYL
jgi:hypothetical protein